MAEGLLSESSNHHSISVKKCYPHLFYPAGKPVPAASYDEGLEPSSAKVGQFRKRREGNVRGGG